MTSAAIRLLRPRQWSKGLLVFAALLFTRSFTDASLLGKALLAFVAMSLVSSAVYVLNDLRDIERDRSHPVKQNRPLASGSVTAGVAWGLFLVCLLVGLGLGLAVGTGALGILLVYLALQVVYNLGLKHQPVADVFTVALGFILRAVLGAAAIEVLVSPWLLFCTGALALLLGFAKRRNEFILQGDQRHTSREALALYNRPTLDAMVMISAAGATMSYGIYAVESPTAHEHPALVATCLFVFYGIYRYVYLTFSRDEGGEPENLLFRDPHLMASILLFAATAVAAMMGMQIPFIESGRSR